MLLTKEEKKIIYQILRKQRKYIFSRRKKQTIERILLKIEQTERNIGVNEIKPPFL